MAENFGEQFAAARETLGLSVGEVASRTKIRAEYLEFIEKGDFSLELPAVYIRGFVRNYAKFLKLNVGAVMRECPVKEVRAVDSLWHASELVESVKREAGEFGDMRDDETVETERNRTRNMFLKLREKCSKVPKRKLAISAGIGLAFLLLVAAVFLVRERRSLDLKGITPAAAEMIPGKSITLSATGAVKVVVRNGETLEKVYTGNLSAGTAKTISYHKPIQVFYDRGEHLLIQQDNGEKIYPQPGRGGIEIK
ncbi:MAG: helix-turn-helix domain-containing protein [Puniceicoccales bacterium]|jgi:transcriptional regulator with XRE-family HTH domain|nr:helix-turn-helix domain-containing protein [Puniceicoccales bacterium]